MFGDGGSFWSILVQLVFFLCSCFTFSPAAATFLFCLVSGSLSVSAPTAMQRIKPSTSPTLTAQRGVFSCMHFHLHSKCHSTQTLETCACGFVCVRPYSSSSSAMLFCPASCLFLMSASISWMSSFITFRLLSGLPSFRESVLFTSAAFSWRSEDTDAERLQSGARLKFMMC